MHGLTLTEIVIEEGVSGSIPVEERPAGGALFARLERGDMVIAAKLDRLFRSALDALKVVAEPERARGQPAPPRSRRRHCGERPVEAVSDDRRRLRRSRTRSDQRKDRAVQGRPEGSRTLSRRDRSVRLPSRRAGRWRTRPLTRPSRRRFARFRLRIDERQPLRVVVEAMAARGHKISHQGVVNIVKAQAAR